VTVPAARRYVIAVGGDVPPELDIRALQALSAVLICRGADDPFYAPAAFDTDVRRLSEAAIDVEAAVVPGGHAWSAGIDEAAGRFLQERVAAGTSR
jgi:predicted esterase